MRTAVVSGGSRGLGLAIVRKLLTSDWRVMTFSRSSTPEIDALRDDPRYKDRFLYRAADASDSAALAALVKETHQVWGRIDALINNAAVAHDGLLLTQPDDEIEQMLAINLQASIVLAREAARMMLLSGGGNIINISSIVASRGYAGLSVYSATKGALESFTRTLARELAPRNIRVNCLAPGYLDTEMSHGLDTQQREQIVRRTPLGRLGTTDDVIPWVEFLLDERSRFVTGQTMVIDGGATI